MTYVKTVLGDGEQVHLLFARTSAPLICFYVGICKGQVHCYLKAIFKTLPDFLLQLKFIHFTIKQGNATDWHNLMWHFTGQLIAQEI